MVERSSRATNLKRAVPMVNTRAVAEGVAGDRDAVREKLSLQLHGKHRAIAVLRDAGAPGAFVDDAPG